LKKFITLVGGGLLCQAFALPCLAAGGIVLDGSTVPNGTGPVTLNPDQNGVITIDATMGTGSGDNLFQSFDEFNVGHGQTAEFTDSTASGYQNVIARVTGNDASEIFGEIRTGAGLENANLFLINPNGILFGDGASVNINGAFYASTADSVIFANSTDVALTMNKDDVNFSSAPISAFGFTNVAKDAAVTIENTTLNFNGGDVGVYANKISISGSGTNPGGIISNGGDITLVAAGESGQFSLDPANPSQNTANGAISMNNASVVVNGDANIVLRGGKLMLQNNSQLQLQSTGSSVDNTYPRIDIVANSNIDMNQSRIESVALDGRTADISITTGDMTIQNGAIIFSGSHDYFGHELTSGDINIHADRLSIIGQTRNEADAAGYTAPQFTGIWNNSGLNFGVSGSVGNINIIAHAVSLTNNASILSENYGPSPGSINLSDGDNNGTFDLLNGSTIVMSNAFNTSSGDINIAFGSVTLSGTDIYTGESPLFESPAERSGIRMYSTYSANGGDINISGRNIRVADSAVIVSESADDGSGGNIYINGESIIVSGRDQAFNDRYQNTSIDTGAGIETTQTSAGDFSIEASASPGGNIALNANYIEVSNYGHIATSTAPGSYSSLFSAQGQISLSANDIRLDNHASISSSSYYLADYAPTGNISISANNYLYINNSNVSTSVLSDQGSGGDIYLTAAYLYLKSSTIDTSATLGSGGNININALFGIITSDTVIDAHSEKNIDGNINISFDTDVDPRTGLSIKPIDSSAIRLANKCDVNDNENSSLLVIGNNKQLQYDYGDAFSIADFHYTSIMQQTSVNDCLRPALSVSLL